MYSSPIAGLSILAGLVSLGLAAYVWREFRDRPGALYWVGSVATMGCWALFYGGSLMVFDPVLREWLEALIWLPRVLAPPFVLAFAFAYTGRAELIRSPLMGLIVVFQLGNWVLYATNPLHGLVWTNYEVVPTLGAAAAAYELEPVMWVGATVAYLVLASAIYLLVEAVLEYGELYRFQLAALAVGVSVAGLATGVWLLGLGPLAPLDLTPIAMLLTVVMVTAALFSSDGFDVLPATRRLARSVAIDDLDTAVFVCSRDGRLLHANTEAIETFQLESTAYLTRQIHDVLGVDIPLEGGTEMTMTVPRRVGRTYRVTVSSVTGDGGSAVGYTVTFKDVTRQQRRRQQLEVLNRVLRHNLRNDGTVIAGTADLIADLAADLDADPGVIEQIVTHAETVATTTRSLTRTGEKARDIANALPEEEIERREVPLSDLVESVRQSVAELDEDVTIRQSIPASASVETDRALFGVVLENLVENAIFHGGSTVTIAASVTDDAVSVEVSDDGEGIPEHELEVLEAAGEDPLTHGSGMGLWIVAWGMEALGGEITFDVHEGTTVTLVHPHAAGSEPATTDHQAPTAARTSRN